MRIERLTDSLGIVPRSEAGGVFAKRGTNLTVSGFIFTAISRHITMTCIDSLDNLHWILVESRRKIIDNLKNISTKMN
jgi:hypothetical protein